MQTTKKKQFEKEFSTGVSQLKRGKTNQAKLSLLNSLLLDPNRVEPYINLGAVSFSERNWLEAEKYFVRALKINPGDTVALYNLGLTLKKLGKFEIAKEALQKSVEINPKDDAVINELGVTLNELGKTSEAITAFLKAAKVNPKNELALYNLGRTLMMDEKSDKAIKFLKRAYRLDKNDSKVVSLLYSFYRGSFDWEISHRFEKQLAKLTKRELRSGLTPGENPFTNVTRVANPKLNLQVARGFSREAHLTVSALPKFNYHKSQNKKIRVGYASDGFREFPTAHNLTGVLENHDRGRFEIFAYSFGLDDKSRYRERIISGVDEFVDVYGKPASYIARKINSDKIDILVDLKGFTRGAIPEILALRPAPIQVLLLGFVGTTGAPYMDYFITDKVVTPPAVAKYFSEELVFMPDTYWPTDNKLEIRKTKFERKDFGIPKNAFVFGSFNQGYKIEERVFKTWLKILEVVPNSILFIYVTNPLGRKNLIKYAKTRGINPKRIIFAQDLPKEKHLARIRDCIDLSLDTLTVNGHTTTTDCLWAGIPVITLAGKHFASRVSASMLTAIGTEEMITKSLKAYEDLAVSLAKDKSKLLNLRSKLLTNKKTYPLFDTPKYTRNLEKAYEIMHANYKHGQKKNIVVG